MTIFYPYNELLPKRRAHAIYLSYSAFFFAKHGLITTLAYGGKKSEVKKVQTFYELAEEKKLFFEPIFHIRKNNFLKISWNLPFFYLCQKKIQNQRPNIVITSVFKQGNYHVQRRVKNIRYIYEVHELCTYPNELATDATFEEKKMLEKHDLLITTTHELKAILKEKPYSLSNPIEVVPLATHAKALPSPTFSPGLKLFYIGSFEKEQGLPTLLHALSYTKSTHLTIIGGTELQIAQLKNLAHSLGVEQKVSFLGFQLPAKLQTLVQDADAFIAPFGDEGKMAYVAHTKLADYTAWQRPLIAPDLAIVKEHVDPHSFFYENKNIASLAKTIEKVESCEERKKWHEKKSCFDLSWDKRTVDYLNILKQRNFF